MMTAPQPVEHAAFGSQNGIRSACAERQCSGQLAAYGTHAPRTQESVAAAGEIAKQPAMPRASDAVRPLAEARSAEAA